MLDGLQGSFVDSAEAEGITGVVLAVAGELVDGWVTSDGCRGCNPDMRCGVEHAQSNIDDRIKITNLSGFMSANYF
jgi:hypothetical protein